MRFQFNTGRLYAKDGQPINVEVVDGRIWFYDEARGIAGSIEANNHNMNQREVQEAVMFCYDRGLIRYERIPPTGQARCIEI